MGGRGIERGSIWEVFIVFLRLGCTSFGGPIAHLGYFRTEFVERRAWLNESQYTQLVALCQFLPGPASSQVGFGLGLVRAGWPGALAAFTAFTLPSALLLFVFAIAFPELSGTYGEAAISGLKLVALAVVAHAVLGMVKGLCPDVPRKTIAALAAVVLLVAGNPWLQVVVVGLGGLAGLVVCRAVPPIPSGEWRLSYGTRLGWVLIFLFALLLVGLPLVAHRGDGLLAVIDGFYRAGALVFGGGHVVLPLLEQTVVDPGWISREEFLAGYGAAQAIPGPMFTLAAYLGERIGGSGGGLVGAVVALLAIFVPGFLLVAGVLPLWRAILRYPSAAHLVAGINASVVGLLAAALYDPVWTSAVRGPVDVAIALVGFMLLVAWRVSALFVVFWSVLASIMAVVLH